MLPHFIQRLVIGGVLCVIFLVLSGFDFTRHSLPLEEIRSGGPARDAIPALLKPKFLAAKDAAFLQEEDRVLGVTAEGEAKAYPLKILNWHEIVNDEIAGRPILVTYCPLCGSGVALDPVIEGKRYTFGVSGLLYKSDVLMYDHQTESLWSQLKMEAVTGPLTGARLNIKPLVLTTWGKWREEHSETLVLSLDTGFDKDYSVDPYAEYARGATLMFPVGHRSDRFHPKERVLGVEVKGVFKAYPFSELPRAPTPLQDSVAGQTFSIKFDEASQTAMVFDSTGNPYPSVTSFWFAWYAFHPDTLVYAVSSLPVPDSATPYRAADYFPLAVGNRWTYEEAGGEGEGPSAREKWEVVSSEEGVFSVKVEKVRFDIPAVLIPSRSGTPGDAGEDSPSSPDSTDEYMRIAPDGLKKAFASDGFGSGTYVLKEPLRKGTQWWDSGGTYEITAIGSTVDVPAGKFTGCLEVTYTADKPQNLAIISTYAPKVGLVHQRTKFKTFLSSATRFSQSGKVGADTVPESFFVLKEVRVH